MIRLSELLHSIAHENEEKLTPIDNWNIAHVDQLIDMGFKHGGMYEFVLDNPRMELKHKEGEGFILTDVAKKKKYKFPNFKKLFHYFETYQQEWENSPYKSKV